ncbi:TrkH family potassium uptake protein [Rickettsiales bacterium LUAb2]
MWINFRAIIALLGYLTSGTGILMLVCSIIELFTTLVNFENFFITGLILLFVGFSFGYSNKQHLSSRMSIKEGLLLTFASWCWVVFISSLPFYFSELNISFVDALFETMSGLTTTGATIFARLDELSYGLNLWRALLQWIGGVGIIVTSTALISQLGSSGMQIFKIEGFEVFDNPLDKAIDIIKGIVKIYVILTIIFFLALWLIAKMDIFNALIHTLTNISTAGFSTKDQSLAYFDNHTAEVIIMLMMVFGGSPFILIYYSIFLRKPTAIFTDEQFRGYISLLLILSSILSCWLFFNNQYNFSESIIYGSFTVVSTMTGTGSVVADYTKWGTFPTMLLFITMFIGGCGGSSACGMKVYRFQIAYKVSKIAIQKIFLKNHVILPYYNNSVVDNQFANLILVYFFLMFVTIMVFSAILSMLGLDFDTAFSGAITCLMNVGPGIGNIIGPVGNFSSLPEAAKFTLTIAMFIGRIEIFGAFVLFHKSFWRA